MKDKVFIAWSGSNEIAFRVKSILEKTTMCVQLAEIQITILNFHP